MLKPEDIAAIFEWIELLLIASLKRNLARHKDEEEQEGFTWSAWQAEKLRSINTFRRQSRAIMDRYKDQIDDETRQLLEEQFEEGMNGAIQELEEAQAEPPAKQPEAQPQAEEPVPVEETPQATVELPPAVSEPPAEITVEAMPEPVTPEPVINTEPQFFGVDRTKMDKLIEDVTHIEKQAETAALRMTDDVYRQTVNRVQLAMSTGSITYAKAVDMAVADFLAQGINCIEYRDGRRVNIADYVRMVLRTTSTRAALQGKSEGWKARGYDTVQVSSYGMCSKTCLPWQGRVYINDAFMDWQGETKYEGDVKYGRSQYCGKWFPLLSSAIAEGLFHPNCKHGIGLYIDGSTKLPKPMDNSDIERRYKEEQHQRALEREVRKAKRKVEGFTDPANIKKAKADLRQAQKELKEFIEQTNAAEGTTVLKRDYGKETSYGAAELTEAEKNDIIKYEENQKKLREMIANGDVTLTINPDIQDRHYQGTSAYKTFLAKGTEESYFLVSQSELQEILNQRYATGSVRIDRAGVPREIFDCGKELAYDTKLKKYTSFVKVHYSKTKTHLSPYTPNDI